MKTALVLTTINTPTVLKLYAALHPAAETEIAFFVIGDLKTPPEAEEFCKQLGAQYYSPERQRSLGYKCSELLGWNCIQRRNVGFLEALKSGAEIIVSIDDDVNPIGPFFDSIEYILSAPFDGIEVSTENHWFDPGQLLTPTIRHRGMPTEKPSQPPQLSTATGAKVGVVVGLWMGDADVDATVRISNPPAVYAPVELARSGVVVHPETWTVFNAQNVAFVRELAPAMFQMPGIGRADDIFASLITQRIMRHAGYRVHIGQPFTACWQSRSKASLLRDLEEEMFMLRHVLDLAAELDAWKSVPDQSVANAARFFYSTSQVLPTQAKEAAAAWIEDVASVM